MEAGGGSELEVEAELWPSVVSDIEDVGKEVDIGDLKQEIDRERKRGKREKSRERVGRERQRDRAVSGGGGVSAMPIAED